MAIHKERLRELANSTALIVAGWDTSANHFPENVDSLWLAKRDLEISKTIRDFMLKEIESL